MISRLATLCAALAVVSNIAACTHAEPPRTYLTVDEVLADLGRYHARLITVRGYLSMRFEDTALYARPLDKLFEAKEDLFSSLRLGFDSSGALRERKERYQGALVEMVGVLDACWDRDNTFCNVPPTRPGDGEIIILGSAPDLVDIESIRVLSREPLAMPGWKDPLARGFVAEPGHPDYPALASLAERLVDAIARHDARAVFALVRRRAAANFNFDMVMNADGKFYWRLFDPEASAYRRDMKERPPEIRLIGVAEHDTGWPDGDRSGPAVFGSICICRETTCVGCWPEVFDDTRYRNIADPFVCYGVSREDGVWVLHD